MKPASTGLLLLLLLLLTTRVLVTDVVRLLRICGTQSNSKKQLQNQKRGCLARAAELNALASSFRIARDSVLRFETKGLGWYRLKVGIELNNWLHMISEKSSVAAV